MSVTSVFYVIPFPNKIYLVLTFICAVAKFIMNRRWCYDTRLNYIRTSIGLIFFAFLLIWIVKQDPENLRENRNKEKLHGLNSTTNSTGII